MGFLEDVNSNFGSLIDPGNGPWVADLQRNYRFSATFTPQISTGAGNLRGLGSALAGLFPGEPSAPKAPGAASLANMARFTAMLLYVSTLVKAITPPQRVIETSDFQLGPLTVPLPSKVTLEGFDVTFLHDVTGMVESFYNLMVLAATSTPGAGGGSGYVSGSLTFQALASLAVSLTFTRTMAPLPVGERLPQGPQADIPLAAHYYPRVFPVSMKTSEFNKSGDELSEITMSFIRLPVMRRLDRFTL